MDSTIQQNFSALFDHNPNGIALVESEHYTVIKFNPSLSNLISQSRELDINLPIMELLGCDHPELVDSIIQELEKVQEVNIEVPCELASAVHTTHITVSEISDNNETYLLFTVELGEILEIDDIPAMSNIIDYIATEWQMPLKNIVLEMQQLQQQLQQQHHNTQQIDEMITSSINQLSQMSHSINDFWHFFHKQSTHKGAFKLLPILKNLANDKKFDVYKLNFFVSSHHKHQFHTLPLHQNEDKQLEDILLYGYEDEFMHSLEIILQNSVDAGLREVASGKMGVEDIQLEIYLFLGDNNVQLSFIDNGDGFNEKKVNSALFKVPFYKGVVSHHLYLAKSIIEHNFHGSLELYHHQPKGSTILIELPLHY